MRELKAHLSEVKLLEEELKRIAVEHDLEPSVADGE